MNRIEYKLKVEARKFFDEKLHNEILPIIEWNKKIISASLLDELPKAYIVFGKKMSEISTSLCGMDGNKKEAHFDFTVKVQDVEYKQYDKFKVAPLLDELQAVCDKHFKRVMCD